jgi:uncharacterized protein DUF6894
MHERLYPINVSLVTSSLATVLMAQYYFHVRTERGLVEDEEGIDLPHMQAVRREALVSAHEFMAEAQWSGALAFEVVDAAGETVLTLPIQAVSFAWPGRANPAVAQELAAGRAALH